MSVRRPLRASRVHSSFESLEPRILLSAQDLLPLAGTADAKEPNNQSWLASSVSLNGSGQGTVSSLTIDSASDVDWFSFVAPSGASGAVEATMTGVTGGLIGSLAIYDNSIGTLADVYPAAFSRLYGAEQGCEACVANASVTLDWSGLKAGTTYYVKASGLVATTGSYALSISAAKLAPDVKEANNSSAAATNITSDLVAAGGGYGQPNLSLDNSSDEDWFRIDTPANTHGNLTVRVNDLTGGLAGMVWVYQQYSWGMAPATLGVFASYMPGGAGQAVVYNAQPNTTYFIRVDNFWAETGGYDLDVKLSMDVLTPDSFEAVPGNNTSWVAAALPTATPTAANIHSITDVDWYRFTMPIGGTVTERITLAASGNLVPHLAFYKTGLGTLADDLGGIFDRLYGPEPEIDATGTGQTVSVTAGGLQGGMTYYVRVSGLDGTTGSYSLSFQSMTVQQITVNGPSSVMENGIAAYTATATFTDTTTADVTDWATWTQTSTHATIDARGYFTVGALSADGSTNLTANYGGPGETIPVALKHVPVQTATANALGQVTFTIGGTAETFTFLDANTGLPMAGARAAYAVDAAGTTGAITVVTVRGQLHFLSVLGTGPSSGVGVAGPLAESAGSVAFAEGSAEVVQSWLTNHLPSILMPGSTAAKQATMSSHADALVTVISGSLSAINVLTNGWLAGTLGGLPYVQTTYETSGDLNAENNAATAGGMIGKMLTFTGEDLEGFGVGTFINLAGWYVNNQTAEIASLANMRVRKTSIFGIELTVDADHIPFSEQIQGLVHAAVSDHGTPRPDSISLISKGDLGEGLFLPTGSGEVPAGEWNALAVVQGYKTKVAPVTVTGAGANKTIDFTDADALGFFTILTGPGAVASGGSGTYTLTGYFEDGSIIDLTPYATWGESSGNASIVAGVLSVGDLTMPDVALVTATWNGRPAATVVMLTAPPVSVGYDGLYDCSGWAQIPGDYQTFGWGNYATMVGGHIDIGGFHGSINGSGWFTGTLEVVGGDPSTIIPMTGQFLTGGAVFTVASPGGPVAACYYMRQIA